ncbi:hypothetical protein DFH08DRAFT_853915 [Mycena albidolilacea]|uniref:BTB domain-containing protein n=1 Tax=Mycena albidolilacea TaxID=1033008 RepID=A0AAD7EX65_9AGAR|nr:hypothetical protein DFH08DRAFT_853915 [Mycena albidolilacea]
MSVENVSTDPASCLPTFTPGSPFDGRPPTAGDVILRSSDGVDFRVHQVVMSLASPIFATMFALPQPEGETEPVAMAESAVALDRMLRFWYPGTEPPVIDTLDELQRVVEILVSKYEVQSAVYTAKSYIRNYLETQPVAVFAFACTQGWEDVAQAAARESLKHPIRVFDDDATTGLKHITGEAYHRLLQYHYRCGIAAKGTTNSLRWVPATAKTLVWFTCRNCAGHPTRVWFTNYLTSVGAELSATPGISPADRKMLHPALKEASKCGVCREQVHEQLLNWASTGLLTQIQAAINEVQLKFI